jgi:hypothetical protein
MSAGPTTTSVPTSKRSFDPDERNVAKALPDSLILKHHAKRLAATG